MTMDLQLLSTQISSRYLQVIVWWFWNQVDLFEIYYAVLTNNWKEFFIKTSFITFANANKPSLALLRLDPYQIKYVGKYFTFLLFVPRKLTEQEI